MCSWVVGWLMIAKHEYAHGDTRTIVAVFAHDWMAYSVITLLAFTNGYVSCIAMMFAPNQATTHDEGEVHLRCMYCIHIRSQDNVSCVPLYA